jgi:hypothetical protein
MASVNSIRPRDRGQLILVTGLTIAVILVMLVLLLNTVIYTENLATRGIDSGSGDAVEYRATVAGSVGELIERENEHYDEGHPPVVAVDTGLETIDEHLQERGLYRGTIAEIDDDEEDISEGDPIVWQSESNEFDSGTIITGNDSIEEFTLVIESVEVSEENGEEETFHLIMDDWSMEIKILEEGSNEWRVIIEEDSGESTTEDYNTEQLEVNIVNDTIEVDNQTEPDSIEPSPPESAEAINYENGDLVTGTFELRTDGEPNDGNLTKYEDEEEHYGNPEHEPYYTYPVESVDLVLHYETSELRFVTRETIIAEEEVEP